MGLQDPDLDPSLFLRIRILPLTSEKSKKNLDFHCFGSFNFED
jgi:hypothetical protein